MFLYSSRCIKIRPNIFVNADTNLLCKCKYNLRNKMHEIEQPGCLSTLRKIQSKVTSKAILKKLYTKKNCSNYTITKTG